MALITLGLSHHSTPIDLRERMAFAEADLPEALARLRTLPGVSEAAILSTCNRTELFAVTEGETAPPLLDWWRQERQMDAALLTPHVYTHHDRASVVHTLRVASGLDSMVLGEPQILGQMKQSFALANNVESLGPILSRLFQHAFAVAKLVRSQTDIGAHPVSVAYAAVQMARRIFEDLKGQTALLIGAGEMVSLVARYLQQQGVGQLIVANRSLDRAAALAAEVGGRAVPLDALPEVLPRADFVVSSTASREPIIRFEAMKQALRGRRRRPVFMIDLAVPRDIEPRIGTLDDVYLYTIDDLRNVVAENRRLREDAAQQAERLIETQAQVFTRWLEARDAADTIRALRAQAERHREEVLARADRRLANGESAAAVLRFVAEALSNKLLHAPVSRLRQADGVELALLLNSAQRLFDLDPPPAGASDDEPGS
jgi:glutamyl-tRNA reductase